MDKEIFDSIARGAEQAVDFAKGKEGKYAVHKVKVPKTIDVKKIRTKLGMTQRQFCDTFGFTTDSVKSWETGRRKPDRTARILLKLIKKDPGYVLTTAG